MERLGEYFRTEHGLIIGDRTSEQLAQTLEAMRDIDPQIRLGITGSDAAAPRSKRVDVTVGRLREVLEGSVSVA